LAKTDWQMDETVMPSDFNEIGQEINHNSKSIGDLSELETSVKSSLVGAINEVKQSGSEWKSAVAGAITAAGVPTAATDNRQTFVNHIGDLVLRPGINWSSKVSPADNWWISIGHGNGMFVAVAAAGNNNRIMYSFDGNTWTAIAPPVANIEWRGVCYGNGLFVAVGRSSSDNRIMTSPDGVNWTIRTGTTNNEWNAITYGNGVFVISASTSHGAPDTRIMTSSDGVTWTARYNNSNANIYSVAYGNNMFVAVGQTDISKGETGLLTSPDGVIWTPSIILDYTNVNWTSVYFGGGLFVAISINNKPDDSLVISPDGINWTKILSDGNLQTICYGAGLFVATYRERVLTSPDGINWTQRTAISRDWLSMVYGNGKFIAVANAGTGVKDRIMISGLN